MRRRRMSRLLVETNGVYASSPRLKALMEKVNRTNVAVLWDVHHPARYKHETPAETYQQLEPWIRYVHVKDSIMVGDHVQYKMMGEGDIPIKEALDILFKDDFEGFVSLEWVKRWSKDIEDAAIVFPAFCQLYAALSYADGCERYANGQRKDDAAL